MQGHAYTAANVRPRHTVARSFWSSSLGALAVCGLCLVALALVWVLAELVPAVHVRDAVALNDFTRLDRQPVDWVASHLIHLLEPSLFILWGVALVAFAIARERPRTALAVVVVMGLAPLTSETLKPLLAHSHASVGGIFIGDASWPSGHSTAGMALALSAVLVAPARLRPVTMTLGALFAAAVGISLLILAWHMPSDVIGGYLVAIFWTALVVAALRASDRRRQRRSELLSG
jgi:membrane-associated phospholipid phosphatase